MGKNSFAVSCSARQPGEKASVSGSRFNFQPLNFCSRRMLSFHASITRVRAILNVDTTCIYGAIKPKRSFARKAHTPAPATHVRYT